MKTCYKCKTSKNIEDFSNNHSRSDGHSSLCKECSKQYLKDWYVKNKKKHISYVSKDRKKKKQENSDYILSYLKSKECIDCGYSKSIIPLEFDHVRGTKIKEVSVMISDGYPIKIILEEIEKCDIVCSNCHRIRTETRRNSYRAKFEDRKL